MVINGMRLGYKATRISAGPKHLVPWQCPHSINLRRCYTVTALLKTEICPRSHFTLKWTRIAHIWFGPWLILAMFGIITFGSQKRFFFFSFIKLNNSLYLQDQNKNIIFSLGNLFCLVA